MRLNSKQIVQLIGATYIVEPMDGSVIATSFTWDSRQVKQGSIFIALQGENADGHKYIDDALRAGAVCIIVTLPPNSQTCALAREMGASIIEVSNAQTAINDLAKGWRAFLKGKVIAVTGSSGKTTTKNLIRDILSTKYRVSATCANQNNELGVPNTILNSNPEDDVIVIEMGMRGLGQIRELCEIAKPDWGVISNIGESHIELLGSKENIADAKSELFCALPDGCGRAFIGFNNDFLAYVCSKSNLNARNISVVEFGVCDTDENCEVERQRVWASDVSVNDAGYPIFYLHAQGFGDLLGTNSELDTCKKTQAQERKQAQKADSSSLIECSVALHGLHNVENVCAAAAVGLSMNMTLEQIADAMRSVRPESGRQEVKTTRAGFVVVDDTYNANPDSMRASLLTFNDMDVLGRRVVVVADMAELGEYAVECHKEIGRLISTLAIDRLICYGDLSKNIANCAIDLGMDTNKVVCCDSIAEILEDLDFFLDEKDAVLIKGSHCMGLSRVVEGLMS